MGRIVVERLHSATRRAALCVIRVEAEIGCGGCGVRVWRALGQGVVEVVAKTGLVYE